MAVTQGEAPASATEANRRAWDSYAREYQEATHAALDGDVFWGPCVPGESALGLLGDVGGRDVLELGCGGGQAGVWLATRGARVTALDVSENQLEHGRALARARGVEVRFVRGSADDLSMLPDGAYDVVLSSYAMGFVEDAPRAFREAFRVLRPGGLLAFSWSSPIQMSTELAPDGTVRFDRSYFDRSPLTHADEHGVVVSFHRTYGDWLRALVGAGFVVTDLLEPEPVEDPRGTWRDSFPPEKLRVVPGTAIWRARKPRQVLV